MHWVSLFCWFIFNLCRWAIECPPARHSQNRSDPAVFLLVLRLLCPARGAHVPDAHHRGAVEDHHPLATLLLEEDRLVRVIDLGDGAVGVAGRQGVQALELHAGYPWLEFREDWKRPHTYNVTRQVLVVKALLVDNVDVFCP